MEDENSWVFDSLVALLNGPIWSAPLDSFIEEKSLIFEPSVTDKVEYKEIFDEFKNLVDFMLGNFMEDIGITPEQFEDACNKSHTYSINFNRNIFEQIWAANDYEMFKRMMTQRNVELQLQALELIEQKYGITPQSFVPQRKAELPVTIEKSAVFEAEVMNEVAKNFPREEIEDSTEAQYILEEKEILQQTLKETKEAMKDSTLEKKEEKKTEIQKQQKVTAELHSDSKTKTDLSSPQLEQKREKEMTPGDLKKRQEYLRAQRDKLVALKKEARKKQLGSEEKSKPRPKSAKAAEAVLSGETPAESQQLQIRKALAERLKSEVVANKI